MPVDQVCPQDTEIIVNSEGVVEYCRTDACPDQTQAIDTNTDGIFDVCEPIEQDEQQQDEQEQEEPEQDEQEPEPAEPEPAEPDADGDE